MLRWLALISLLCPHLPISASDGADTAAKKKAAELFAQAAKSYAASQYAMAAEELTQSLRLDPQQPRAAKVLGLCYQLLGNLKRAEAGFAAAAKLDGDDAETWFFLGRVYYMEHLYDNARTALQAGARLNSGDPQVHELLALTLVAIGDTEGALAEFEEGVRLNARMLKPLWTPHLSYGVFLHQMNRMKESEEQLRVAAKLNPNDWMAHFELGKLLFGLDRFAAAVEALTTASQTAKPGSDEASRVYQLLGRTYYRMGREEDARNATAKAGR